GRRRRPPRHQPLLRRRGPLHPEPRRLPLAPRLAHRLPVRPPRLRPRRHQRRRGGKFRRHRDLVLKLSVLHSLAVRRKLAALANLGGIGRYGHMRSFSPRIFALLAALAALPALAQTTQTTARNPSYRIGPKDLVAIQVFEVPELNVERRVTE